ncbi:MAG TPA: heavy metal translocating P-type ATPase, partial [Rhizomicrobium sp.]|nr:heavy metal translocating P-type ATPase [Rhizomicrobium sp.]
MGALSLSPPRPEIADNLARHLRRGSDGGQSFEVAVKGAHCAGCMAKIERGVGGLAGISSARLNLSNGKLTVAGTNIPPALVLQRIRDLGYEAQPFDSGRSVDADEEEGRFLLRCLAVSGFATVFVMGLTDAVWYGGDLPAATRQLFFWLAGAVAIPASFYAGLPFFRAAWRARGTNMDVPISLALILSLGLSVWQTAHNGPHTYFDAAIMLTFLLLIGRYLDFRLRDRARDAARHLLAMQSVLARRIKPDDTLETVAARELKPGDRVLLACGDRLPVNGILEDRGTELDVSLVTGEVMPQRFDAGAPAQAGAIVTGTAAVLRATARVEDSLVADLARLLEAGQQSRGLYVRLADRAARTYVPVVLSLAVLVLGGWLAAGAAVSEAVTNAITVLIITCPCALGLAVPAVQIVATGRLFRQGVFVKSGDALERLAEIDTAIFDKTGTLTLGSPMLSNGAQIPRDTLERAARIARASRHPFAKALAHAAGPGPVATDIRETPGAGLERGEGADRERLGNAAWCGVGDAGDFQLWYRRGQEA